MDELERFAYLKLDDDDEQKVVSHGQVGSRTREVIIPHDEVSYEKVCLERWPNAEEEKRILNSRLKTKKGHTWESFYHAVDEKTGKFAARLVFEQRRIFGRSPVSSKRQKSNDDLIHLPTKYSVIPVAANADFAVLLCRPGDDDGQVPGGRIWMLSTSNFESAGWRRSDIVVKDFQAGFLLADILYIVSGPCIDVYKLPRAENVYHLDVWQAHEVLLSGVANVIRASPYLVLVVTRQRGFIAWQIVNRTLQFLHYENPNEDAAKTYQYTTASIFMDHIALGRTDGMVEVWKLKQTDGHCLVQLSVTDWFEPVHSTVTGKLIEPTQGLPINCVEICGPKLAISTEKDLVMVNQSPDNALLCKLTDVATPASITLFGDVIAVLTRDGGFSVGEFGSGRTYCNTTRSIEDAPGDCVVGQQWIFISGDLAAGLWPNGNLNTLNQNSMKKE